MKYNSNKKVLILGASSDIGLKLIEIYLKNQYKIIAHYNKGNKNFFKLVNSNKNKIKKIKFNFLTDLNQSEKFLKNKIFKNCSVLINALGYLKETNYPVLKLKDLENALKVNLFPGIYLTNKIGEEMNKKKWGRIVHLGSIGVKYGGGVSNFPYSLSKHSLEFIPSYTKRWIKNNVFINTVRVGATRTKLHSKLPSKNLKYRESLIPLKRMANPKEIADFIFYIGSEKNSYISNQILSISGGE